MGWTVEQITSYGVIVPNNADTKQRLADLRTEANQYKRVTDRSWETHKAKVRKGRFGKEMSDANEVFIYGIVTDEVCAEGRLGTMPYRYYTPKYTREDGEYRLVYGLDEDELHYNALVRKHFPDGKPATFSTVMCEEVRYEYYNGY